MRINTQKGLLSEANLTLKKAIEVACNIKAAEAQTSQLKGTNNAPVMAVEHMKRRNGTRPETSPINVGSTLDVGEVIIKPKIVVIKVLNVRSATRLDTCQVCVDPLQQTQARETVNMFDGLINSHNRTLTLTVSFPSFREIS